MPKGSSVPIVLVPYDTATISDCSRVAISNIRYACCRTNLHEVFEPAIKKGNSTHVSFNQQHLPLPLSPLKMTEVRTQPHPNSPGRANPSVVYHRSLFAGRKPTLCSSRDYPMQAKIGDRAWVRSRQPKVVRDVLRRPVRHLHHFLTGVEQERRLNTFAQTCHVCIEDCSDTLWRLLDDGCRLLAFLSRKE